jgi:hypothetical protein
LLDYRVVVTELALGAKFAGFAIDETPACLRVANTTTRTLTLSRTALWLHSILTLAARHHCLLKDLWVMAVLASLAETAILAADHVSASFNLTGLSVCSMQRPVTESVQVCMRLMSTALLHASGGLVLEILSIDAHLSVVVQSRLSHDRKG